MINTPSGKEQTRHKIKYQLKGLEVSLRYLRDALMHTYMDIPIEYFFGLNGNLPLYMEERMPFLDHFLGYIDIQFFEEVKVHLYNTNDKDLAEDFCRLDLLIWQLCILTTRYEKKDKVVKHIGQVAGELFQIVYFLKVDMLRKDFFKFDARETAKMAMLLEKAADEKNRQLSSDCKYAGWNQLESASEACKSKKAAELSAEAKELADAGKFEIKSALDYEDVKSLYTFLSEYTIEKGPKRGIKILDSSKISLKQFEHALWYGCFAGFDENALKDKLHFVICKFSDAYIVDKTAYRKRAALSMNIEYKTLTHYNKDDRFAKQLKEILPLIQYNKM